MVVYPLLYYLIYTSERLASILWITFGLGAVTVAVLMERALQFLRTWRFFDGEGGQ